MYTQCPKCQIAFRVTVAVLQQAGGRVRCGGCRTAFSAIEHLSDELPGTASNQPKAEKVPVPDNKKESVDANAALLKTLDELAGPDDVLIEDTGVEWRVFNKNEKLELDAEPEGKSGNQKESSDPEEQRYDDDTPLPDEFDHEKYDQLTPPTPQRRDGDQETEDSNLETNQIDMLLGDEDDWATLLDDDLEAGGSDENERDAESPVLETPADLDSQFDLQAEAIGLDISQDESAETDPQDSLESPADDEPVLQAEEGIITFGREAEELANIKEEKTLTADGADNDSDLKEKTNLTASDEDNSADTEMLDLDDAQDEVDAISEEVGFDSAHAVADEETLSAWDSDEDDEDELSPEEEADIVQKLRDSTGSFQKQIEAAQLVLNQGQADETEEPAPVSATGEELLLLVAKEENDIAVSAAATDDDDVQFEQDPDNEVQELQEETSISGEEPPDETPDEPKSEADILSETMIRAGIDPSMMDAENIETIVMEGEFVRGSLEGNLDEAGDSSPSNIDHHASLVDTYMMNKGKLRGGRRKSDPVGFGVIAGIAILLLALAAQYLHASRQIFATYGAFNQTLGPIYRALGQPVTPHWNIKGWQFESTKGSTDENEEMLTIFSRIKNTSTKPLPYPLIHVALTDRWEEVIGSKVLDPAAYLAGDLDPRRAVTPGDTFSAVITIENPSPEATGFQLYACYRLQPGRMRCATEDFKN